MMFSSSSKTVLKESSKKLPTAIQKLCEKGGDALLPQFVNEVQRGAAISGRVAASIRKW